MFLIWIKFLEAKLLQEYEIDLVLKLVEIESNKNIKTQKELYKLKIE